ncbi:complement C1q-like protein 4 [Mytilus edulis]|uniref:complement C1q-like protein 4 n=1 Tax=Mytilus edulis TaxID=6550 RepID=UPI0039EE91D3
MDKAKLHLSFMIILISGVQSIIWSQEFDINSTVEVSLLDNQQMPLVALFDTTKLNHVLKDFILQTVNEATDQRISIIKTAVIADIGYEPGRLHERPAFTASLTTTKPIHSNEVVKFDKVWLNMENAYNPITGVFTAPRNGLYFVSSTVRATHSSRLHCHLWKNNQSTLSLFGTNYSTGTINSVMPLKKGDIIYIKKDKRAGETILGGHYSMFSAYLINE